MNTSELQTIDPALADLNEFGRHSQGTTGHIAQMREKAIFTDGAIPARLKALAAALWSISARCEPCLKFYVRKAVTLGATEQELNEILAVASTMGGCVGEMWALKAYHAARDSDDDDAACCQ